MCEVRLPGFPYVGAGNSTNKKEAEKNAAKDFVNYLVRSGKLNDSDVPREIVDSPASTSSATQQFAQSNLNNNNQQVFQV